MRSRSRRTGWAAASAALLLLAGCASGPPPVKPTAGDLERLRAAEQQALEDARTGQSVNWHDPNTGHSGSVTVLETDTGGQTDTGRTCRRIQRVFSAEETTRTGTAYACRTETGDWTVEREQPLLTRDQRERAERRLRSYRPNRDYHGLGHRYPRSSGVTIGLGVSGGL